MTTPAKPRVQIALGIVERNGKVLISKRRPDTRLGDLWEFPGGKIHSGEPPEQAVIRELREELGIGVRVGRFFALIEYDYPDRRVELLVHVCTLEEGKPTPLQCSACEWVSFQDLSKYAFPEANQSLVKRLIDHGLN